MKKTYIFLLAAFALTVFIGCNKNKVKTEPQDTEAPSIIMSSPELLPAGQYNTYTSLGQLPIDIRFEDNKELDRFEVDLRYAPWLYYEKTNNFPWEKLIVGELDGKVGGVNDTLTVPYDPSAGPHILFVRAWDVAGNRTEISTNLFIINATDDVAPNVTITTPSTSNVDSVTIGQDMIIQGTITEPGGLVDDVRIQIRNAFSRQIMEWSIMEIDTVGINTYPLDTFMNIPAGVPPGDYTVEVYGADFTNNVGRDTANFYIKN